MADWRMHSDEDSHGDAFHFKSSRRFCGRRFYCTACDSSGMCVSGYQTEFPLAAAFGFDHSSCCAFGFMVVLDFQTICG